MFLPSTITLKPGDTGDFVAELQRRLVSQHLMGESEITGFYDGNTTNGVKAFQSKFGLSVDGIAGPVTLRAINTMASTNSGDVYSGDETEELHDPEIEENREALEAKRELEELREKEMQAEREREAVREREVSHDKTDTLTRDNVETQHVAREAFRDDVEMVQEAVSQEAVPQEEASKDNIRRANEEQSRKVESDDQTRHAIQDQPENPADKAVVSEQQRSEQLANARESLKDAGQAPSNPEQKQSQEARPEQAAGKEQKPQNTSEVTAQKQQDTQHNMVATDKAMDQVPQQPAVQDSQQAGYQFAAATQPTTMGVASMDPKLQELDAKLAPGPKQETRQEGQRLQANGVEELPLPGDRMPQEISPSQTPARTPAQQQVAQV